MREPSPCRRRGWARCRRRVGGARERSTSRLPGGAAPPARSRRGRAGRASAQGGRSSYRRAPAPRRAPSRVQSPAPLGAAPEPRRGGGLVARLERPLQLAQRLFERAQSREQFVTVHEKNLGPEGGLGGCEARSVARPGPDGRTRRRRPSEIDRKSTRLNSSHGYISYAVFCL